MWPLDARHVAEWLDRYNHARTSYVGGYISRIEALDALKALRYREDALKIEMLEWERAKRKRESTQTRRAMVKLRDYIGDEQTQKRIDPAQKARPGEKESLS